MRSVAAARSSGMRGFQASVVILIALYPIFGQILPTTLALVAYITGTILVLFWFIGNRGWTHYSMGLSGFLWLAFATYVLSNHILVNGVLSPVVLVFVVTVFIMVMVSSAKLDTRLILTILIAMLLVHAIATLTFYVSPQLFDLTVGSRYFHDANIPVDYRSALTSNSGFNAMYCALGLILVATRLILDQVNLASRRVLIGQLIIFATALLLTAKRAHPLFAILVLLSVYFLARKSAKWLKLFAGSIVSLTILVWVSSRSEGLAISIDRFFQSFESDNLDDLTSGRTFLWAEALAGWQEAKLIGNGWGSFYVEWPNGRTVSVIAHNELLNILYEGGLVGLMLFSTPAIIALAAAFHGTITLIRVKPPRSSLVAMGSCLAIQGFLLIYGFTTGELLAKSYTFVPYLLSIGMAYSIRNEFFQGSHVAPLYSGSVKSHHS